jgi:hypothetical protein
MDDAKNAIVSANSVLSRLSEIIHEALASIESQEISPDFYTRPGWDYQQAYLNGRKAGLKEIDRLL